jgi:hypothetical protein
LLGSMRAPDDSEVRAGLVGSARSRACLFVCLLPRVVCLCLVFVRGLCPFSRFLLSHYMCVVHRRAPPCAASCARLRLTRGARWALQLGGKLGTLTWGFWVLRLGVIWVLTHGARRASAGWLQPDCAAQCCRGIIRARMHAHPRARTHTHHARSHARNIIPSTSDRPDAVTAGGDR